MDERSRSVGATGAERGAAASVEPGETGAAAAKSSPKREIGAKQKAGGTSPNVFIDADRRFQLPRPLRFRGATARLAPDAEPLLDVVARIVRENPEIRTVRIRAFWDASLPPEAVAKLTVSQAEAVRDALVKRGVAAERLVPEGQPATAAAGAAGVAATAGPGTAASGTRPGAAAAGAPKRRIELMVQ